MRSSIIIHLIISLGFSLSAYATQRVSCSVMALGAGQDNVYFKTTNVELATSPSGQSMIGKISLGLPAEAPVENNQKAGVDNNVYQLEMSLRLKENSSRWEKNLKTLNGHIVIKSNGKVIAHAEASSDTAYNPSDLRLIKGRNVSSFTARLQSPEMYEKVLNYKDEILDVTDVRLSTADLITELGMSTAVAHLAARGLVKASEVSSWMVVCNHS